MKYIINNNELLFTEIPSTGVTSKIFVSQNKKYVIKQIIKFIDYDVYKREKYILSLLNSNHFEWCPQLICSNDNNQLLVLNYCGEILSLINKPLYIEEQFNSIINDLESLNIKHNDIKNTELLIKDNKLYICDYGWASINNNYSCGINIWNGIKPYGCIEDRAALSKIELK